MELVIWVTLLCMSFLAGVLVGRANPKKADKLADLAEQAKHKIKEKAKK